MNGCSDDYRLKQIGFGLMFLPAFKRQKSVPEGALYICNKCRMEDTAQQ